MQICTTKSFGYENPLKLKLTSEFLKSVPTTPGIYFMLDRFGSILYIGKAKNLRNRLSTYFSAKPGRVMEHTLEMLESVCSIQFQTFETEQAAIIKENELLHAVRPPYNIADTQPEHYLFIGTQRGHQNTPQVSQNSVRVAFQLSRYTRMKTAGYQVYGCFKQRRKVKSGYTALLRLLYAATTSKIRFAYPAKITRVSPPWLYQSEMKPEWLPALDQFLKGESIELLHLLFQSLLESESIPQFMRPSLSDDFEVVKDFYELGPKATYNLKIKHRIQAKILSIKEMDRLICEGALLSA